MLLGGKNQMVEKKGEPVGHMYLGTRLHGTDS